MNMARALALTLSALCIATPPSTAAAVVERVPAANGEVNWSAGALRAMGSGVRPKDAEGPAQGRLLARRAAIADAYRNLAHLIGEVRVTANTTVQRYVTADDTIRMCVEAFIRGAQIIEEKDDPDGTYTVTLQVGMAGKQGLTGIILPRVTEAPPPSLDFTPRPAPAVVAPGLGRVATPGLEEELLTAADARGPFTGVIIDARGLNVQPAMSPRIYSASGKEIYGTVGVDASFVEEIGIAGYMGTIRAAMGIARVGRRPLVVRATGTPDQFRRYVTVSDADADRIVAADRESKFLEKAAVIIVVDERHARDEGK